MVFQRLLNDDPVQALPVVIAAALIYWFIHRAQHKRKYTDNFAEVRKQSLLNEIIRLIFVCYIA